MRLLQRRRAGRRSLPVLSSPRRVSCAGRAVWRANGERQWILVLGGLSLVTSEHQSDTGHVSAAGPAVAAKPLYDAELSASGTPRRDSQDRPAVLPPGNGSRTRAALVSNESHSARGMTSNRATASEAEPGSGRRVTVVALRPTSPLAEPTDQVGQRSNSVPFRSTIESQLRITTRSGR